MKFNWEVTGQGTVEFTPEDVKGMSKAEIEDLVEEHAHLMIHEQGDYSMKIRPLTSNWFEGPRTGKKDVSDESREKN